MKIGKAQGLVVLTVGIILLVGGILVLIIVPSWGNWIAAYPTQIGQIQLPPLAAPLAQGIGGIFGPLLVQVGGYIRIAGYFAGSLLTLISLVVTAAGTMIIKGAKSQS